jgi:uncharacterized protein (TIGR03435 family)
MAMRACHPYVILCGKIRSLDRFGPSQSEMVGFAGMKEKSKSMRLLVGSIAFGTLLWGSCVAQTDAMNDKKDPAFEANPAFAVATVKLSPESEADDWGTQIRGHRFVATHVSMNDLMGYAYGVNAQQIDHAPAWFGSERFDLEGVPDTQILPTRDEYRTMVQKTLTERFGLKFRSAQKMLTAYVLSVNGEGLKIPQTVGQPYAAEGWGVSRGRLQVKNMSFAGVARVMQRTIFDRPVVDETHLSGRYSFELRWNPDELQFGQMQGLAVPTDQGSETRDDIYIAARKQLGLKIEAKKTMVNVMVIDAASQPEAN